MRTYVKLFLLTAAAISLISCKTPVESMKAENNSDYKVHFLFEHDGCKVYRFFDRGHYVYFSNCTGNITRIESEINEDDEDVSTENRTVTITRQDYNQKL